MHKTLDSEMFIFLYFWMVILFYSPRLLTNAPRVTPSNPSKRSPPGIGGLFTHKAAHCPLSQAHICPMETGDSAEARIAAPWSGVKGKEN